ncbi:MAG: DUF6569 family protein [Spirochaetota bacterium]
MINNQRSRSIQIHPTTRLRKISVIAATVFLAVATFSMIPAKVAAQDTHTSREPARLSPDFRPGSPIIVQDIVIWPLLAETYPDFGDYITLREGLESGLVVISESGGEYLINQDMDNVLQALNQVGPDTEMGQQARVQQDLLQQEPYGQIDPEYVQQLSNSSRVNTLSIVNNSGHPLFIMAGEVITGGKQNRAIQFDVIIPPESGKIALDVFCVEQGRWHADKTRENPEQFDSSLSMIADQKVRKAVVVEASQQAVWDSVAKRNTAAGVDSTDYTEGVADLDVQRKVEDLVQYVRREFPFDEAAGLILMHGVRVVGGDILLHRHLLQEHLESILRGYLFEVVIGRSRENPGSESGSEMTRDEPAGADASGGTPGDPGFPVAEAFLQAMLEARAVEERGASHGAVYYYAESAEGNREGSKDAGGPESAGRGLQGGFLEVSLPSGETVRLHSTFF